MGQATWQELKPFGDRYLYEGSDANVIIKTMDKDAYAAQERMHRIADCWNACLGIEDPAKEIANLKASALTKHDQDEAALIRNQNARLRSALKPFANYACKLNPGETCECHNCAAKAALKSFHVCPKCHSETYDSDPNMILTSHPPKKSVRCPSCQWTGFRTL